VWFDAQRFYVELDDKRVIGTPFGFPVLKMQPLNNDKIGK